jgi:hypothetical protein
MKPLLVLGSTIRVGSVLLACGSARPHFIRPEMTGGIAIGWPEMTDRIELASDYQRMGLFAYRRRSPLTKKEPIDQEGAH